MCEQLNNPMWSCWCVPEEGTVAHSYTEIACPRCGRLQPPKNIRKILMHNSGPDEPYQPNPNPPIFPSKVGACLPNPDDKKLLDN